ncbi:pyridoxal-phosphate-dependent serine hydroxymethyltransferase, putative (DUF632) [Wolffia australiana]
MGCCQSRMELEETLSRCRGRRRYMKQLVKGRQALAAAHFLYLRSLRCTGSALLQFASAESPERHHLPPSSPPPQPKAPSSPAPSACSEIWTSAAASPAPPHPPPPSTGWDFWDLFLPTSRPGEEEWVGESTVAATAVSEAAAAVAPASELVMVVSRSKKGLTEIVRELDDYFLKATEAGNRVSVFLEVPNSGVSCDPALSGKICGNGRSLSPLRWPWGWSSKASFHGGFERLGGEGSAAKSETLFVGDFPSHRSTVEKMYAWEKKLFLEAKNAERLKDEHEKKVALLRRLEARAADYLKVEKTKKEIERLHSRLAVASQAIDSTSLEIVRLRESELFPQLLDLLTRLRGMWRSMYECHQVQTHIVNQLEFLNEKQSSSQTPTSDLHRQATLQLELEVQQWHAAFCDLVESQRDYIHSLTGWLRLSLFGGAATAGKASHHLTTEMYSLLEEWELALDRVPDKVASEGIKSFLSAVHAVVLQQEEEHRQRRRAEAAERALERAATEWEERAATAKARAEEERRRWEKLAEVTRAMTLNSLQTGFPNLFQAMTGFSGVCSQAFDSIYDHRGCGGGGGGSAELKMLLD